MWLSTSGGDFQLPRRHHGEVIPRGSSSCFLSDKLRVPHRCLTCLFIKAEPAGGKNHHPSQTLMLHGLFLTFKKAFSHNERKSGGTEGVPCLDLIMLSLKFCCGCRNGTIRDICTRWRGGSEHGAPFLIWALLFGASEFGEMKGELREKKRMNIC